MVLRIVSSGMFPPRCATWSDTSRASVPCERSTPPRWRRTPRVAARSVWVRLSPSVIAIAPPLPKMRRASLSPPSDAAPACRSRARARETGTPSRASLSAGATVVSQRACPWRTCINVIARTPLGTVMGTPRMPPGAETGPNTNASPARVLASCTMHTPEAPRLAADGKVTAIAKYIATAASVALPPASRMSRPTSAARLSSAETAANLTPPRNMALSGARLAATPVGLATFSGEGSLPPQAESKNVPISASLRN